MAATRQGAVRLPFSIGSRVRVPSSRSRLLLMGVARRPQTADAPDPTAEDCPPGVTPMRRTDTKQFLCPYALSAKRRYTLGAPCGGCPQGGHALRRSSSHVVPRSCLCWVTMACCFHVSGYPLFSLRPHGTTLWGGVPAAERQRIRDGEWHREWCCVWLPVARTRASRREAPPARDQ